VGRWAWRLFRREWRQQFLVLALLSIAIAATTLGLGVAVNADAGAQSQFGNADYLLSIPSTNPNFEQDVAAATAAFSTSETVYHSHIALPGSVTPLDLRFQDPSGALAGPTVSLLEGEWPEGASEIAVTRGVIDTFGLTVNGEWQTEGQDWTVVGVVENPLNLVDDFALASADYPSTVDSATVWGTSDTPPNTLNIPGAKLSGKGPGNRMQAEVITLVLAALGAVFVGLVAVAGFAVVAQRRLRGLGMLGALGATPRLARLALVANGAIVGLAGALTGTVLGVLVWFVAAPAFEQAVNHRIDRANLPWIAIVAVVALGTLTAIVGSWWPARTAARAPIVSALAMRPPPPRKAHSFGIPGVILLAGGVAFVAFAPASKPAFSALGVAIAALGTLLIAPLGLMALAKLTNSATASVRLAVRDLVRYRARSGGSVAAVSLAVAIAVAISVSAGAAQASANASEGGGNLPDNQMVLWLGADGADGPIPAVVPAQFAGTQSTVDSIVTTLGAASSVELDSSTDPEASGGTHVGDSTDSGSPTYDAVQLGMPQTVIIDGKEGNFYDGQDAISVFVATPELLAQYGIEPSSIQADADLVTSQGSLDGYELIPVRTGDWVPVVQQAALPTYSSTPTTLITQTAMDAFGLIAVPTGWLVTFDDPMTSQQRDDARELAAKAGLSVELRPTEADLQSLRLATTLGGMALALAVLAMTVGLIRSETSSDLSTLAAIGANSRVRREITASTAAALGLVGGILGAVSAYAVLLAWYRHDLSVLSPVPVLQLIAILVGLPVVAWLAGWMLGGREPYLVNRRRID